MGPIFETKIDDLPISIYPTNEAMGMAAAGEAATVMQAAIETRGQANIIIATGNSQLTFLEALSRKEGIDWSKVNVLHMDEYVGLAADHPASFPLSFFNRALKKFIAGDPMKPATNMLSG